jgi:hypothetical protein
MSDATVRIWIFCSFLLHIYPLTSHHNRRTTEAYHTDFVQIYLLLHRSLTRRKGRDNKKIQSRFKVQYGMFETRDVTFIFCLACVVTWFIWRRQRDGGERGPSCNDSNFFFWELKEWVLWAAVWWERYVGSVTGEMSCLTAEVWASSNDRQRRRKYPQFKWLCAKLLYSINQIYIRIYIYIYTYIYIHISFVKFYFT